MSSSASSANALCGNESTTAWKSLSASAKRPFWTKDRPLSYWRRARSSLPCAEGATSDLTVSAATTQASSSDVFFMRSRSENSHGRRLVRRDGHELARRVGAARADDIDAI